MSRRLSPLDILHADFSRSVGGYDRREVRAFLERLSTEVEAALREMQALRQELERAEERARFWPSEPPTAVAGGSAPALVPPATPATP